MNKTHRFLVPSVSLLLVGAMFSCGTKNANYGLLGGVRTNVTITFDAGIGEWYETGTSIRKLTLLKGYTWNYIKENLNDDLRSDLIDGRDIDVVWEGYRTLQPDNAWILPETLQPDAPINEDIIVTANYIPEYISITFVASPETEDPSHHTFHTAGGGTVKQFTVEDSELKIEKGTRWGSIKNEKIEGEEDYVYIPYCETGYENEPFLCFVNESGKTISDEYILEHNDILTATYQINHPTSFVEDSWETISKAADLGFDYMSGEEYSEGGYNDDYEATQFTYHGRTYSKAQDTFVGLKHDVQIGQNTYHATVIDENVDKFSSTTNATLTFKIDEIVNANKAYDTLEHNLNRYGESALRSYLNDNFRYTLSPDLQNAIVPVNKFTNYGGRAGSQGDIRESSEYIFALSLRELDIDTTYEENPSEKEGVGPNNEQPYKFYDDVPAVEEERIGKTLNGDAVSYWVRSPDPDSTGFAYSIDTTGVLNPNPLDNNILLSRGVLCAFCVGAQR